MNNELNNDNLETNLTAQDDELIVEDLDERRTPAHCACSSTTCDCTCSCCFYNVIEAA
jgi:hypothetical protein